jgi:sodium/potassium-transporting ATPase subunit alpha
MAVNSLIIGFESLVPEEHSSPEKRIAEKEAEESTKQGIAGKVMGPGAKRVYVVESPIWDPKRVPPALIRVAGLCNNAKLHELPAGYTGDPTEGALLVFANNLEDFKKLQNDYPRLEEFPFDSLTKRMEVICRTPEGKLEAYLKGAPEIVVEMCGSVLESGGVRKLQKARKKNFLTDILDLQKEGNV